LSNSGQAGNNQQREGNSASQSYSLLKKQPMARHQGHKPQRFYQTNKSGWSNSNSNIESKTATGRGEQGGPPAAPIYPREASAEGELYKSRDTTLCNGYRPHRQAVLPGSPQRDRLTGKDEHGKQHSA
jgi:hypothetical protein